MNGRQDAVLWIACAVAAALLAASLAVFSSGAALPFVDNFDDRRSGWDVFRLGMGGYNYRDGEFAFWISRGGPHLWLAWSPLSESRPETLVVEATAYALSGGGGASYGVIFGLDMANYYAFEVRADGYYRVFCRQAGESLCEPAIWTRAGSAASGSAADRLRVVITGDRAALEVNGLELGAISLAALKGPYRVGICGGCEGSGPAEVRFTQFAVSIPSQAEVATAEAAPPVYPVCSALQQPGVGAANRLQEDNPFCPSRLAAFPSARLADNRIGAFFSSLWRLEPEVFPDFVLDAGYLLDLGVKRVRFSINEIDSPKVHWSKPEFSIDPDHDEFITSLADNGVGMTYVLSFWDTERVAGGWTVPSPRFKTESEIQRYLDFVRFIVGHFKDRIERYEIWNEPSIPDMIQSIEVEDYLRLVERAVPVVRKEYPEAEIVVGGTHSLIDAWSQQYLARILRSDIMPLVDVVSWHPMYGSSPEYDGHREYYYAYPCIVRDIKSVAFAHGFYGEFVADEIHWNTPDLSQPPWPTYSETKSTKYYLRVTLANLTRL